MTETYSIKANIDVTKDYELKDVPINLIATPGRVRRDYGDDFDDLVTSIKNNGLIHPLCVMKQPTPTTSGQEHYHLLAGGRRYKALHRLKYEVVPCKVYPYLSDPHDVGIIELEENIKRKALTWQEDATAKKQLHEHFVAKRGKKPPGARSKALADTPAGAGHSRADTARAIGESPANLSRDIKLADMLEQMPELAECKTKKEALQLINRKTDSMLAAELARRAEARAAKAKAVTAEEGSEPTPDYDEGRSQLIQSYIHGDCLELMPKMESNVVNFIDLDWPYGIDLKGKLNLTDAQKERLAGQHDLDHVAHKAFMERVIKECFRILKPNGWLVVWYPLDPWHETIRNLLIENKFTVGCPAMWIKSYGHTRTPNCHLANCYEPFFYARKGEAVINKVGHKNTFHYGLPSNKVHPTEKPIELMQDILETFTFDNATVMVPFLGSGNTLLASANLNRNAFGWDLDEEYRNQYIVKVQGARSGEYTSYKEVK